MKFIYYFFILLFKSVIFGQDVTDPYLTHFKTWQPYLLSKLDNSIMLGDSYNTVSSFFT